MKQYLVKIIDGVITVEAVDLRAAQNILLAQGIEWKGITAADFDTSELVA